MDFNQKIQNLTQQLNLASREVIIQDRMLGQTRERAAELQGRINMLLELQETYVLEEKSQAKAAKKKK